jgi:hypothetical protein
VVTPTLSTKERCVLCLSKNLITLIKFPETPIANEIIGIENRDNELEKFPLILGICEECRHVQLLSMIDPVRLFSQYSYQSNSNQTTENRLNSLAIKLDETYGSKDTKRVLEIGSNDGFLLQSFSRIGWKVLGIDPAKNISAIANARGVETINAFFTRDLLPLIEEKLTRPDLIIANNVLAHTDELVDIFDGINLLMDLSTVLIVEFSYLGDVYKKLLFDTIYHEHTSYHSIFALRTFLQRYGLEIFEIERISAHGGSVRVHICRTGTRVVSSSIELLIREESESKINELETWSLFAERIDNLKTRVHEELDILVSKGERIIGYGVPAKFATLFHVLELDRFQFEYLIDDNELKIGGYGPGTRIEIKSYEEFSKSGGADNVFLFSWNYSTEIVEKLVSNKLVRGKILVPLPELQLKEEIDSN